MTWVSAIDLYVFSRREETGCGVVNRGRYTKSRDSSRFRERLEGCIYCTFSMYRPSQVEWVLFASVE